MTSYDDGNGAQLSLVSDMGGAPAPDVRRSVQQGPRRLHRRRLAILYGDVAGYTRLMCEDEDATHRRLDLYLDILSSHVLANRGTVCHYAGDAVLASFASVTDAMVCAVAVQEELARRNRRLRRGPQVRFRIGLNVAEVILARGEIFGIGVNVAARLQALAAPGGVCISDTVRRDLEHEFGVAMVDLGECVLKNVNTPVRAWRLELPSRSGPRPRGARTSSTSALAAALNGWINSQPVPPARESRNAGRGSPLAMSNLTLVGNAQSGLLIQGCLGRRTGACRDGEAVGIEIPVPHGRETALGSESVTSSVRPAPIPSS